MIGERQFDKNILYDVDYEIVNLIKLINQVNGIETTSSCFGHNKEPIRIYCVAKDISSLNQFIYNFFYGNKLISFKILVTDTTIDNKEWDKIEFIIESDIRYIDYPCTQLIADDLTHTFEVELKEK